MKIYDSHIHIFNSKIVENVVSKTGLAHRLALETENADNRLTTAALVKEMRTANVRAALMLPTADVNNLSKINRNYIRMASKASELFTAGTLHPDFSDIGIELSYLSRAAVRVIKLCSFSQGFALNDSKTYKMFDLIQTFNSTTKAPFSVVLDTLTLADRYFGTNPEYTTTPQDLMDLVRCFPGINFIGAHMGGLGAPFELSIRCLKPLPNLYLDTSNAAHTLKEDQFIQMLHRHGSRHILFGTDWPWFLHVSEVKRIDELMEKSGFSKQEKEAVFSKNLANLLGINPDAEQGK
jgi:predicted TIM-barrel fold metal-dependent hydrolase